jgi:hypothetical protein
LYVGRLLPDLFQKWSVEYVEKLGRKSAEPGAPI